MTDGYRPSSAHGRNRKLSAWAGDSNGEPLAEFVEDDDRDGDDE